MSGCEPPVRLGGEYGRLLAERDRLISQGVDPRELIVPLEPRCDCDHGEDDPCCSETETPEDDRPRDDL